MPYCFKCRKETPFDDFKCGVCGNDLLNQTADQLKQSSPFDANTSEAFEHVEPQDQTFEPSGPFGCDEPINNNGPVYCDCGRLAIKNGLCGVCGYQEGEDEWGKPDQEEKWNEFLQALVFVIVALIVLGKIGSCVCG